MGRSAAVHRRAGHTALGSACRTSVSRHCQGTVSRHCLWCVCAHPHACLGVRAGVGVGLAHHPCPAAVTAPARHLGPPRWRRTACVPLSDAVSSRRPGGRWQRPHLPGRRERVSGRDTSASVAAARRMQLPALRRSSSLQSSFTSTPLYVAAAHTPPTAGVLGTENRRAPRPGAMRASAALLRQCLRVAGSGMAPGAQEAKASGVPESQSTGDHGP